MKDARLYGAQGAFQNFGDLFVAESLAEAEDERLPLAVGKLGDTGPEALFPFLDFAHRVGARAARRLGWLSTPQDPQLSTVQSIAPALTAIEIEEQAIEPGINAAAAFIARRLPRQDEECFLSQVVGIPRIARQDQRGPMDACEVLLGRFIDVDAGHHLIVVTAVAHHLLTTHLITWQAVSR